MELKEIFDILKKNAFLLIMVVVLSAGAACAHSYYQSLFYEGVFIFSVRPSELSGEDLPDAVDGYYLVESERLFGRRLGNFLALAKESAGANAGLKQISDFDYKISIKAKDENGIYQAKDSLESDAADFIENISFEMNAPLSYSAAASEIKIAKIASNYLLAALIAALGGLLAGVFAVLLKDYLKS